MPTALPTPQPTQSAWVKVDRNAFEGGVAAHGGHAAITCGDFDDTKSQLDCVIGDAMGNISLFSDRIDNSAEGDYTFDFVWKAPSRT